MGGIVDDDSDYDHSEAPIKWLETTPPLEIVAFVRASIKADLVDLEKPADLIFHTVFLSPDMSGPAVILSGDVDSGGFFASYEPEAYWTSLDES